MQLLPRKYPKKKSHRVPIQVSKEHRTCKSNAPGDLLQFAGIIRSQRSKRWPQRDEACVMQNFCLLNLCTDLIQNTADESE